MLKFMLKESNIKIRWFLLLCIFLLSIPLFIKDRFIMNMAILILMWACLGSAWNIFGGYTGQVSLGNAIFFAVGAYSVAVFYVKWNVTPWIGMLVGILFATIIAIFLALPLFRLSAQYFAIATVALGEAFRIAAVNCKFIYGATGIDILKPGANSWYSVQFASKTPYYYFFLIILGIVFVIMLYINSSKMGYYFRAIKANEISAASVGINTRKYKTIAFIISGCITSLCGSFYAQYQLYIDPTTVLVGLISTKMIMIAVCGGLGTMAGPIIGAIILVPLSEYTRVNFASVIPGSDQALYGIIIIVIAMLQPNGVLQIIKDLYSKMNKKNASVLERIEADEPSKS